MRCVVIGGLGFIGQAIVRNLLARGDEVTILDKHELAKDDPLHKQVTFLRGGITKGDLIVSLWGAEEVYLMAGCLGTSELDQSAFSIRQAVEVNTIGAANVFDAAARLGARVFYPSKPNPWLNTYTITKVAGEQFARLYNERGKCQISSLRYFNVFGPGQKIYPVRKMLPVFALQAMHGLPIQVYGDGTQTVDLLYVEDAAELAVRVTRAGITEVMDAGRGTTIALSVNEAARIVNLHFGNKAGVEHLPMRDGESPGTQLAADAYPIRNAFPDFHFAHAGESIKNSLDWYAARPREELDAALEFYGWKPCSKAS